MVSIGKLVVPFVVIATSLFVFACQEKYLTDDVNCDECYVEKPDSVDIFLNLSISNEYQEIPVVLYKGLVGEGTLIDTFYCYDTVSGIFVKAEERYSAKAIYTNAEKTVIVVDGIKQQLKHVADYCDQACWVIEGDELSLELVY